MTREQLFQAMVDRRPVTIQGREWLIQGVTMEDGSGYSFILNLLHFSNGHTHATAYYRCSPPDYKLARTEVNTK